MITEKILGVGLSILEYILRWVPKVAVPTWLSSPTGAVGTVFSAVGSMGVWFPGALVVTIIGAVFAVRLTGLGIKVARMILSLFTGGGGNAGL